MEQAFKDMLMKRAKEQGKVDPNKLKAKAEMMKSLSDMLGSDMKEGISKGMKKVTVASDSEEGLEKGLELAKKKLGENDSEEEELDLPEEEEGSDEEEASESEDSEIAELEKKIEELKAKKIK